MNDCLFCKIAAGEIPADIVYEDGEIMAFKDIRPLAPVHILLICKKHLADISAMSAEDIPLIGRLHKTAVEIAHREGIAESGFRLVNNCKKDSGQEVPHLHYHLIGGAFLGAFTASRTKD
jgi:histidine triad (HIT) family protein